MSEMSPQHILEAIGDKVSEEITSIVYQNLAEPHDPQEVTELLDSITEQLTRIVKLRLAEAFAEGFHGAVYASTEIYLPSNRQLKEQEEDDELTED